MGRRTIHQCDGCGTENEETDHATGGVAYSEQLGKWGHLHVGGPMGLGSLPVAFDLCDSCIGKIIKLLGLHVPDEQEIAAQFVGMGVPYGAPHIHRPTARRPPGMRVVGGGLTKEDLEQCGIEPKGVDVASYKKDGYRRDGAHVLIGTARPLADEFVPSGESPTDSCECHHAYKCIPEACEGHCEKCLGR